MEEREEYLIRNGLSKLGLEQERKKGRHNREPEKERYRKIGPSAAQQNTKIRIQWQTQTHPDNRTTRETRKRRKSAANADAWIDGTDTGRTKRNGSASSVRNAPGTLQHLVRECRVTSREVNLEDILRGKRNEKTERWLEEIKWEEEARSRRPEGIDNQRQYAVHSYYIRRVNN